MKFKDFLLGVLATGAIFGQDIDKSNIDQVPRDKKTLAESFSKGKTGKQIFEASQGSKDEELLEYFALKKLGSHWLTREAV